MLVLATVSYKLASSIMRALTTILSNLPIRPAPRDDVQTFPLYQDMIENISPEVLSEINAASHIIGQALLDDNVWPGDDTISIAMPIEDEEEEEPDYPLPSDLENVDPYWWDNHPAPEAVVYPIEVTTDPPSSPGAVSPSDRMVTLL